MSARDGNYMGIVVDKWGFFFDAIIVTHYEGGPSAASRRLRGANRDDAILRALLVAVATLHNRPGAWTVLVPSVAVLRAIQTSDSARPEVALIREMLQGSQVRLRKGVLYLPTGGW